MDKYKQSKKSLLGYSAHEHGMKQGCKLNIYSPTFPIFAVFYSKEHNVKIKARKVGLGLIGRTCGGLIPALPLLWYAP